MDIPLNDDRNDMWLEPSGFIHDTSLTIEAQSWLRFKLLSWLMEDATKFKVVRIRKMDK